MTAPKLTPAQVRILGEIAAGGVWRSERIGDLYRSYANNKLMDPRPLYRLSLLRLIRLGDQVGLRRMWEITDAGRDRLNGGAS